MFTTTYRQFIDQRRDGIYREYGPSQGLTRQAIRELFPDSWFDYEYINLVNQAARAGQVFNRIVLDRIYTDNQLWFWHLLRHHERILPEGYLNPNVRRAQREQPPIYRRMRGRKRG